MHDIKTQFQQYLSSDLPDFELDMALKNLDQEQLRQVTAQDPSFALQLYQRSPYIFTDFISRHLSAEQASHLPVIHELLQQSEANEHPALFISLYKKLATVSFWNEDFLRQLQHHKNPDVLRSALQLRAGKWSIISEENLIALYHYNPKDFVKNIGGYFPYLGNYQGLFHLPEGNLTALRTMLIEAGQRNTAIYRRIFRHYATHAEWMDELRYIIQSKPDKLISILEESEPATITSAPDKAIIDELKATFGTKVASYIERIEPSVARQRLEEIFATISDNEALLNRLQQYRVTKSTFALLTPFWAMKLYERDLNFFWNFIVFYAEQKLSSVQELLNRAQDDGHYNFYRQLYARVGNQNDWNAQILHSLQTISRNILLEDELSRLDVQRERQFYNIDDASAAQLYRRSPEQFREFVFRYIPAAKRDYPLLLQAIEEQGDMDFWLRIFRKITKPETWEREMERLLAQDIPASEIVAELDKRKPLNPTRTNAAVLAKFLQKYGEVVLPFFENYIDWTTPSRLERLLNLDLDRAILLRELQTIARRQPFDFSRRAAIWAENLYNRSPDYFGSFIAQHLTGNTPEVADVLLRRIEADGYDRLFSDIYRNFYQGDAWQLDIARLLRSNLSDDTLDAALARRVRRWESLPDDLATELYLRNPAKFSAFVGQHVQQRWHRNVSYDKLRQAAKKHQDTQLLTIIKKLNNNNLNWQDEMKKLLRQNLPADQIVPAMVEKLPQDLWNIRDLGILADFIEKYGDAVFPFFFNHINLHYLQNHPKILEAIKKHANKTIYWRFFFAYSNVAEEWYDALKDLCRQSLSEDEFSAELLCLTPEFDSGIALRWKLRADVATVLYQSYPHATLPFIKRHLEGYSQELYQAALKNQDDEFVDFLTYHMLLNVNNLLYQAYPKNNIWYSREPDLKARSQLKEISDFTIARFDKLYESDPQAYIRSAANILSFVAPFTLFTTFDTLDATDLSSNNPIWTYLATQHYEAWRKSPAAITELLESPIIFVQLIALQILQTPGPDTAQRVAENLASFRALLLSDVRKATKRKALACLVAASQSDSGAAEKVLPMLNAAMNFSARRAIADEITQAYVYAQEGEIYAS